MSETVEKRAGRSAASLYVSLSHCCLFLMGSSPFSQYLTGDYQPLDLGSPLVNFGNLRVAEKPLHFEFLGIAIAAMDLHRFGRGLHRGLGRKQLGDRGFLGVDL